MIVAGFGYRTGATIGSLRAALMAALERPAASIAPDASPSVAAHPPQGSAANGLAQPTFTEWPRLAEWPRDADRHDGEGGTDTLAALAAPADKCALLAPLAAALRLRLIAVPADALTAVETPTRSPASLAAREAGSVAEAAALAAAGRGGRLIVSRRISPDRMATCAIAEGVRP